MNIDCTYRKYVPFCYESFSLGCIVDGEVFYIDITRKGIGMYFDMSADTSTIKEELVISKVKI